MRSEYEVNERINTILEKVNMLLKKREEEMGKSFEERDHKLVKFINRECNVYYYSLSQLRWLYEKEDV